MAGRNEGVGVAQGQRNVSGRQFDGLFVPGKRQGGLTALHQCLAFADSKCDDARKLLNQIRKRSLGEVMCSGPVQAERVSVTVCDARAAGVQARSEDFHCRFFGGRSEDLQSGLDDLVADAVGYVRGG